MEPKPFWKSKTNWIATAQLVGGFLLVMSGNALFKDNAQLVGYFMMGKSAIDYFVRFLTTDPVKI